MPKKGVKKMKKKFFFVLHKCQNVTHVSIRIFKGFSKI